MQTLDNPTRLYYNNGNPFPGNFITISYVFMVFSLMITIAGALIIGPIILLFSLFGITSRHIVKIDVEKDTLHDFVQYLGFIKMGKKYPLHKYKYITAMPLVESRQMYSNALNSSTITNTYTTVTFFGDRLKGKRVVTKYESKSQALETAEKLGNVLDLKFFEYDPILVREVLLGKRSL